MNLNFWKRLFSSEARIGQRMLQEGGDIEMSLKDQWNLTGTIKFDRI